MKTKLLAVLFALCALVCVLAGCTGETPEQTGATEGCLHRWMPATCMQGKTCSICGFVEGDPVDHAFGAWLPNGDQTHTRVCAHNEEHVETAACFGGIVPEVGATCPDCGYVSDPSHTHTFNQQVVAANYKAADPTCEHGTGYFYTCSCGLMGMDIFYSGQTLAHTEVIDPEKPATFSVPGLTAGSHCGVCDVVITPQVEIPALGSDVAVGTDYYDKKGQTTYRYSYSFTLMDNDRFNLTTLQVGSDGTYKLSGEEGTLGFLDNGIYELKFDSGRETMYGKIHNGKFEFCNRDGSKWKDKDVRPHGGTSITITPRPGNSTHGFTDLARNPHASSMQELYYRLYAACEAFMSNGEDIAATNGKYVIDRINLEYYILTADDAVATWKVFYVENPRYYWLANSLTLSGGMLEVCIDPAYASGAYRASCDAAIDAMAGECAGKLTEGMSELKKALTIHDYIISRMDYAYKADGKTPEDAIWAHNMIGCAQMGKGVCETYAKTYQYLCRLNGLECQIVTGFNGENHAWNVVKIDGNWYGVDCTFDETNTDKISYNCFGMPAERMRSEYVADSVDGKGIAYLYQLPELAEHGVELVDLYKNGSFVGTYANIDAAFAAMTDVNGEYEVRLYNYDRKGPLLLSAAVVEHHIYATQMPTVKKLAINGAHAAAGDGYYINMKVLIEQPLIAASDLTLENVQLHGKGSLNILSNQLEILGGYSYIFIPLKGSMDSNNPSKVVVDVETQVDFSGEVEIYTLQRENNTGYVMFRRNTHIVEVYAHSIEIFDDLEAKIDILIDRFYPLSASEYQNSNIKATGPAMVRISEILESDRAFIELAFGKLEEFPTLNIGKTDSKVRLALTGITFHSTTDIYGNTTGQWIETIDPRLLNGPVATLGEAEIFDTMTICISELQTAQSYRFFDRTYLFCVNEQGQIIYR